MEESGLSSIDYSCQCISSSPLLRGNWVEGTPVKIFRVGSSNSGC